jgi:hypothetical protein
MRGGIRAIYFYVARYETVLLMVAYAKNTQERPMTKRKQSEDSPRASKGTRSGAWPPSVTWARR